MTKPILGKIVPITIAIFAIVFAVASFQNSRKVELDFNEKKATLIKENLDLKDRIDAIQKLLTQKTEAMTVLEDKKNTLDEELDRIKEENQKVIESSAEQLEVLKKKNQELAKKVTKIESSPLIERIKEALGKKENQDIKKVLEYAVDKINLIKSGKAVNLEPIIVTKTQVPNADDQTALQASPKEAQSQGPSKQHGLILSLDQKNNLIVINLGRKEGIKEGDICKVLKDDQEIARGEIISLRYRISAAFIDSFQPKFTINDVKENYKILVTE